MARDVSQFLAPTNPAQNGSVVVGYCWATGVIPPPINSGLTETEIDNKYGNRMKDVAEKVTTLDARNLHIKFGEYNDLSVSAIFGQSASIGTTLQNIAAGADIIYYPTSGVTLGISSTDTDDNSSGTGARAMLLKGLDENYVEQQEIITLNGTGVVNSTKQYIRVQSAVVNSAGTSQTNEGDIYVADATDTFSTGVPTQPFFTINRNWSIGQCGIYTVPSGQELTTLQFTASADPDKPVMVIVETMRDGTNTWLRQFTIIGQEGGLSVIETPLSSMLPAKTDIRIRGSVAAGQGETQVNLAFLLRDEC